MLRSMCKSKIANAAVTERVSQHVGSIGIDKAILEAADILPSEQVHVLNMNNGERFITYAIEEKEKSGKIVMYGPSIRKAEIGDELVILSYCLLETKESHALTQRTVLLGKNNQLKSR